MKLYVSFEYELLIIFWLLFVFVFVRRLKHTSLLSPFSKRLETLEDLTQKMVNSGHRPTFMKNVMVGGILRFEAKVRNSLLDKDDPKYKPVHQPSGRNLSRLRKKAMAKNNWYRDKPEASDSPQADEEPKPRG